MLRLWQVPGGGRVSKKGAENKKKRFQVDLGTGRQRPAALTGSSGPLRWG
jgi:hypothetical protein